jgi:hypothetical protein
MNALGNIQSELKAPKNQHNTFGKYHYRSCEDILEAVKPLLKKYDSTLTISDTVEEIGGRIYVKATATFEGGDGCSAVVTAYAREAEDRKGMDDSQITGATSSYSRKYALNGLFLIDDTKDSDATNNHGKEPASKAKPVDTTSEERAHYKTVMSEIDGAMYPVDVDNILSNRAAWVANMPDAGRAAINKAAKSRREALGGAE